MLGYIDHESQTIRPSPFSFFNFLVPLFAALALSIVQDTGAFLIVYDLRLLDDAGKSLCPIFALLWVVTIARAGLTSKVTWTSPSPGTTYTSNDLINATWISSRKVISPSFKLCVQSDPSSSVAPPSMTDAGSPTSSDSNSDQVDQVPVDGSTNSLPSDASDTDSEECGADIWPTVRPGATMGEYGISLAVPSLSSSNYFYLLMQSDLGDSYKSPPFKLLSDADSQAQPAVGPPDPVISNTDLSPGMPTGSGSGGSASPILTAGGSAISPTPTILERPPPIGPLVPPITRVPISTPNVQPVTASSSRSNAIAAAVAVPLTIVAFAASAGLLVYLLYKRRARRGPKGLASDGLTLAPSRSGVSTLSSLDTMDKFSMADKPPSSIAVQPHYQLPYLGYAPYPYVPPGGLSLPLAAQTYYMPSPQNPMISPPIQEMRPSSLSIPTLPLDTERPNLSRTITPQYGTTNTLNSTGIAPPPPSALRPALGIIPPFHDLTPPVLPGDENGHYETMQSILNSYMEIDPACLNRNLPPVPSPPDINYATRPPLDLDRISR
ncbi:hypothetical protein BS47DRAFT_1381098 [Hydnum rufescens UP504]|uniref:Uncharacterized protein n=1 Tax=Hydnum rufescens UP504 TaxID=1448309 RepID=A0A9P6B298_9AGAM|nr:hypothetical protein BS47DRAFT_1381098 [Hydnum rufescens UP504]